METRTMIWRRFSYKNQKPRITLDTSIEKRKTLLNKEWIIRIDPMRISSYTIHICDTRSLIAWNYLKISQWWPITSSLYLSLSPECPDKDKSFAAQSFVPLFFVFRWQKKAPFVLLLRPHRGTKPHWGTRPQWGIRPWGGIRPHWGTSPQSTH